MTPNDLGNTCKSGAVAGCNLVTTSLGGECQERCVSIGTWPSICSGLCLTDADCGPGPGAPHCTDYGSQTRVCMTMTGNPDVGCSRPDAAVDAPVSDAN